MPAALSALHVGGGGLTLPRYLADLAAWVESIQGDEPEYGESPETGDPRQ